MSTFDDVHLSVLLDLLSFLDHLSFVDSTPLILNTWLALININIDDVILMKFLCPSLWNSILNLLLQLIHIGVLR